MHYFQTPKKTPSKSPGKGKRPKRSTAKRRRIVEQDSDASAAEDSGKNSYIDGDKVSILQSFNSI